MSNLVEHAIRELQILEIIPSSESEMPDQLKEKLSELDHTTNKLIVAAVAVMSTARLSGGFAPFYFERLHRLLNWEVLSPLLGLDEEWRELKDLQGGYLTHQNIRCSKVFKKSDGKVVHVGAIIYYKEEEPESYFTNDSSTIEVTEFPYMPKTEYRVWPKDGEENSMENA